MKRIPIIFRRKEAYVELEKVKKILSENEELKKENKELKKKDEHLTKIITYIMEREDICYIDDGEYGLKIVE